MINSIDGETVSGKGRTAAWWMLGIVVVLMLAAAVIATLRQPEPALMIQAATVSRQDISAELELTGRVVNDYTVTITALLDGQIETILAREGDTVAAGDILAHLDSERADALLQKAQAEQRLRKAAVSAAQRRYDRIRAVSSGGDASRQALEDSRFELRSAEASLDMANADVRIAEWQRNNADVRAPFDGVVTSQTAEKGQWVEAGTPLFTVVADAGRVVEIPVDAGDTERVRIGQTVQLATTAIPPTEWQGSVNWISGTVTTGSDAANTFDIRVPLDPSAPTLLLGEQVDIRLEIDRREQVLVIPLDALIERDAGHGIVYRVIDDVLREQPVSTGLRNLDTTEILSGLADGDVVARFAATGLADGQSVTMRLTNNR